MKFDGVDQRIHDHRSAEKMPGHCRVSWGSTRTRSRSETNTLADVGSSRTVSVITSVSPVLADSRIRMPPDSSTPEHLGTGGTPVSQEPWSTAKKFTRPSRSSRHFARRKRRRQTVGHQPLIAAIQRRFDHMGMLHVHAQHVGHQSAHERELLLALAEDALDAFADAFTLGFQILEQFLARQAAPDAVPWRCQVARSPGEICLPSCAASARRASSCDCCSRDMFQRLIELRLRLGTLDVQCFQFGQHHLPTIRQTLLVATRYFAVRSRLRRAGC